MKITCLDLIPPCYQSDIDRHEKMRVVYQLLHFIIEAIIQSQTQFHHLKTNARGEIHTINLLLEKTQSLKSPLELTYLVQYLENKQSHLNEKSHFFSTPVCNKTKNTLHDFLKSHELIIVIGLIDQYIFIAYFF